MTELLIIGIPLLVLVVFLWVRGIDKMNRDYPEYKGEDYLDEE